MKHMELTDHYSKRRFVETDFVHFPPDDESHSDPVMMSSGRPHMSLYPIRQIDIHIQRSPGAMDTEKVVISQTSDSDYNTVQNYLQYGPANGHEPVLSLARDLVTSLQSPPEELDYLVTSGSGDSLTKLLNVSRTLVIQCWLRTTRTPRSLVKSNPLVW